MRHLIVNFKANFVLDKLLSAAAFHKGCERFRKIYLLTSTIFFSFRKTAGLVKLLNRMK